LKFGWFAFDGGVPQLLAKSERLRRPELLARDCGAWFDFVPI